jgi:ribosomal protein L37AE/L43A
MTELERLKVLSALKLGYGKLTARNTKEAEFKNIEDAIKIIETTEPVNVGLADVNGEFCPKCKSEDLLEISDHYTKCQKCKFEFVG